MTIASTGGTVTLGLYDTQSQLKEKASITYVDNKVDPLIGGHKGFATLAQAQAAQSGLAANTVVEVLSDTTEANNGYYLWNGTTLTKSAYDPLTQAKAYTNTLVSIVNDAWAADLASVEVDADGNIICYVKTDGSRFDENTAAKEAFAAYLESRFSEFTDNWAPSWLVSVDVDEDGDVISYVKNNGKRVDATSQAISPESRSALSIKKLVQGILDAQSKPKTLSETVTLGTPQSTAISGYPKAWTYFTNPEFFRAFGGIVYYPVQGSVSTAAAIKARPAYTAGGGLGRGGFEFYTDAPSFVVNTAYTSEKSFHVYVDDVFVGTQIQAGGERNYWTITFSTRKVRKITLCPSTGNMNGFLGIYTANLDRVFPTKNTPDLRVVWNGDSYCEGALAGNWIDSYFGIVSRELGFKDAWNVAVGGTGVLRKGYGDRPNYRERISDIVDANPDLLIFNLTVNDSTQTPSALGAEITLYIQELRAALPDMWIIIHGVAAASLGPTQNVIDGELACANAIAAIDDQKIAFIPVTTDTAGAWIYGTGYKNAPNGTGNSDFYIGETGSSDFTHPGPDGYAYLSSRLIPAIKTQILKWSAVA